MPYADKNVERAYSISFYMLNKDVMKKRAKEHYEEHKDFKKEQAKEYRATEDGKTSVAKSRSKTKVEIVKSAEVSIQKNTYYKRYDGVEDRTLLDMKEQGKTYKEIAKKLNRSIKSVEKRYARLIGKIKKKNK